MSNQLSELIAQLEAVNRRLQLLEQIGTSNKRFLQLRANQTETAAEAKELEALALSDTVNWSKKLQNEVLADAADKWLEALAEAKAADKSLKYWSEPLANTLVGAKQIGAELVAKLMVLAVVEAVAERNEALSAANAVIEQFNALSAAATAALA